MDYKEQLEEVYECVFGDNAMDRYSHGELKERLLEMYDAYIKEQV